MKIMIGALSVLIALPLATGPARADDAPAAAAVVHINNFAFTPRAVTVAPGQIVRFINDDAEPHTVTATDKTFDSGGLDLHDAWQHAFAKTGTFAFYCEMHPYMKGTIVVRTAGAGQ